MLTNVMKTFVEDQFANNEYVNDSEMIEILKEEGISHSLATELVKKERINYLRNSKYSVNWEEYE